MRMLTTNGGKPILTGYSFECYTNPSAHRRKTKHISIHRHVCANIMLNMVLSEHSYGFGLVMPFDVILVRKMTIQA